MFDLLAPFFFAAPTTSPTTQALSAHWLQGRGWQIAAWSVALVFFLVWAVAVWLFWSRRNIRGNNPFYILFREAFLQFRTPLILLSVGATWITAAGLIAGAQISMILFATLSIATLTLFSLLAWKFWPKSGASGNLFDLLPLPGVQWPHYENEQDRLARVWVQDRVRQTKLNPPAFRGERFGLIVLQTAEELAKIYKKPNILSVRTEALLQGIERTAADMKILCNHLPLADRLTLAEFEKEIQEATKEGKRLYLFLLLILSVVNPGNLLRVLLLLLKARSPWEHVLRDLEAWVYANYSERLGYHMTLIYSGRKPPPIEDLEALIQKTETEQEREARNQKLGTLAFLTLFGSGLYLLLQFASATAFFGLPFVWLSLPMLGMLGYSGWQLRSPKRWRRFWDALRPRWPDETPALTAKDNRAFDQADLVLLKKAPIPSVKEMEDTRELPAHYARILWDLWQACFSAYADPNDPSPLRATRAFYLPQGFAGIEALAHDLRRWYKSDTLVTQSLRLMENFGWDLGLLYRYIEARNQKKAEAAATSTQGTHTDPSSETTNNPPTDLSIPSTQTDLPSTKESAPQSPSFWGSVWKGIKTAGRAVGGVAKDLAIKEGHERLLRMFRHDLVVRLVDIYGARFPASTFVPTPHPRTTTEMASANEESVVEALVEPDTASLSPADQRPLPIGSRSDHPAESDAAPLVTTSSSSSDSTTAEQTSTTKSLSTEPLALLETKSSEKIEPLAQLETKSSEKIEPLALLETKSSEKTEPLALLETKSSEKTEPLALLETKSSEKTTQPSVPQTPPITKITTAPVKRLLLLSRDPHVFGDFLRAFFQQTPIQTIDTNQRNPKHLLSIEAQAQPIEVFAACWDIEENSKKSDSSTFSERTYHHVLVLEEIDYGARGHVARKIREDLFDAMRVGDLGPLCLVLLGVEKLKPLAWSPPYDDYKMPEPTQKKSQRIRQAILAWREAFASFHTIPIDVIFPIGIPKDADAWGLAPLSKHLHIHSETPK